MKSRTDTDELAAIPATIKDTLMSAEMARYFKTNSLH
jgi:hypothetical protein